MSLLDAVRGLLAGSGKTPLALALESDETEVTRAAASNRPGTLTSVGGNLILTNQRLVFTPLNTKDIAVVLTWALERAGAPGVATKLVDGAGKLIDSRDFGRLSGIQSVRPGTPPRLLKPPTILVTSASETAEIGILSGRLSPNLSASNAKERDRMVTAILAQLEHRP